MISLMIFYYLYLACILGDTFVLAEKQLGVSAIVAVLLDLSYKFLMVAVEAAAVVEIVVVEIVVVEIAVAEIVVVDNTVVPVGLALIK